MLGRTYLNLKSTLHLVHSETVTMVNFCTNTSRTKRNGKLVDHFIHTS